MAGFYAFVINVGGDIDYIRGFLTEAEADAFSSDYTSIKSSDPEDPPEFYDTYDPPIVLVVETGETDALETGKYERPVAVFQRGKKWVCYRDPATL